jgi:tetratricopeptide (TPR) repeat protein
MKQRPARWRTVVTAVTLFSQLAVTLTPAISFAQGVKPSVQRGQEYYEQSRFDEAISLLKDLVDRGLLSGEDLQKARELLARSYVKKGYPVQAKEMFKAILHTTPDWRPDPIRVPPDETAVFDQALKEYQAEQAMTPSAPGATPTPVTPTPAPTTPTTTPAAPPPVVAKPAPSKPAPSKPVAVIPMESGKKSSKTLWYVIGGVVVVGAIAAAAGGGGGGGSTPPPPPPALAGFPPPPVP